MSLCLSTPLTSETSALASLHPAAPSCPMCPRDRLFYSWMKTVRALACPTTCSVPRTVLSFQSIVSFLTHSNPAGQVLLSLHVSDEEMNLAEYNQSAQGHAASNIHSWDSNPGIQTPAPEVSWTFYPASFHGWGDSPF